MKYLKNPLIFFLLTHILNTNNLMAGEFDPREKAKSQESADLKDNEQDLEAEFERVIVAYEKEQDEKRDKIIQTLRFNENQAPLEQIEEETSLLISEYNQTILKAYQHRTEEQKYVTKIHLLSTVLTSLGIASALDTAAAALAMKYKMLPYDSALQVNYPKIKPSDARNAFEAAQNISLETAYKIAEQENLHTIVSDSQRDGMNEEQIYLFLERNLNGQFEELFTEISKENILHHIKNNMILKEMWERIYRDTRVQLQQADMESENLVPTIPQGEGVLKNSFLKLFINEIEKCRVQDRENPTSHFQYS